jgi:hypothetical protein
VRPERIWASSRCLVSDLEFRWQLAPRADSTVVEVRVQIPESEAFRLATQQALIEQSLVRLSALAAPAHVWRRSASEP